MSWRPSIDFFAGWLIGLLLCHFLPCWLNRITVWWKFRRERRARVKEAKEDILAKTYFRMTAQRPVVRLKCGKPTHRPNSTCMFYHPPELQ